jgi:hypothetical protein
MEQNGLFYGMKWDSNKKCGMKWDKTSRMLKTGRDNVRLNQNFKKNRVG